MERILLVEDDSAIYQPLTSFLRGEGFAVRQASGQREALALLETEEFDLVLLDVGLRDGNRLFRLLGCEAARRDGRDLPECVRGRVQCCDGAGPRRGRLYRQALPPAGACLAHPQRAAPDGAGTVRSGRRPLRVDTERACVSKNGQELSLSALEYRLLLVFLNHRGATLSRAQLLEEIWDVAGDFVNDNTLTVYIKRLRDKLEDDPQDPALIRTVRGVGYRMEG